MKNPLPDDWHDGIIFEKDLNKVCDTAAKALAGDPRCKSTQTQWWIELCNQLDRNQHLACTRRHHRTTMKKQKQPKKKKKKKKKTKKQNRKG